MAVTLGIDTGGTYTDAALVDSDGAVLAASKALTTYHDLALGIGQAVRAAFDGQTVTPAEVKLVGLSTTLATNASVEARGGRVCLILIGYDPALLRQYGFERELVARDVVYVGGGHNGAGDEDEPLDEHAARRAILAHREHVDAFAVSGYFGVRNPAHELRVRALIEDLTGADGRGPLPVTCGHELTTRLNAVRRATTTALNARLIPLLRELVTTVRRTLDEVGIAAPLMVVKGDGSLVRADWALQRPVETILSGPAASVVGAWHLAGRGDVWVVDVGGTTTDIAALRDGQPRLNPQGAQVGGWRTMVEAVDVHTVGLGGDSHVQIGAERDVQIGPRRVAPLCVLAAAAPAVVDELRHQIETRCRTDLAGQFVLAQHRPAHRLADEERDLFDLLDKGPRSLAVLADRLRYGALVLRRVQELETQRLALRAGFTPTDALHVLGTFREWDAEASRLGATLLASQIGVSPEAFCTQVVEGVSRRVVTELLTKLLEDEGASPDWEREPAARALLARALEEVPASDLGCRLTLRQPVVAVGAPVAAYLPRAAELLSTGLIIPPHAGVANAVGAVAGGVILRQQVLIRPLEGDGHFRIHLPDGVRDVDDLEQAVALARAEVGARLKALAHRAGAAQVEVGVERVDRVPPVQGGWGQEIYLGTELTFTATGRPSPATVQSDSRKRSEETCC